MPKVPLFVATTAAILATTTLGACREGPGETRPFTDVRDPAPRVGATGPGVNERVEGELPPETALPEGQIADRDRPPIRDPIAPGEAGMTLEWRRQMMAACPMLVEDVTVDFDPIPDGALIEFRTEAGDVEDLQRRVEQLASFYEPPTRMRGMMMWQHHMHMRDFAEQHMQEEQDSHGATADPVRLDQPPGEPGQMDQPGQVEPPRPGQPRPMDRPGQIGQPGQTQPGQVQPDQVQPGAGQPAQARRGQQIISPSEVEIEKTEDGARLLFKPLRGMDLQRVRRQVESHEQRFAAGECLIEMPVFSTDDSATRGEDTP